MIIPLLIGLIIFLVIVNMYHIKDMKIENYVCEKGKYLCDLDSYSKLNDKRCTSANEKDKIDSNKQIYCGDNLDKECYNHNDVYPINKIGCITSFMKEKCNNCLSDPKNPNEKLNEKCEYYCGIDEKNLKLYKLLEEAKKNNKDVIPYKLRDTFSRKLELIQQKNIYLQKVIYSYVSLIFILLLSLIFIYYYFRKNKIG